MFDAICVSERTRKPWTVAVSFAGQVAVIGLAVLVPLLSTDALPHRLVWVSVPEPPRGLPPKPAPAPVRQANPVPFQMAHHALWRPSSIPPRPMLLTDEIAIGPVAGSDAGVPGGIGDPNGSGNSVIDSVVRAVPGPPPPAPAAKPPAMAAAIPRIKVGGKVQEGKLISGARPVYPPLARMARVEGTVRLEAVIARDGTVMGLRAVSGHPLLIPAALAAVERWLFRPTTLNGEPVEVATDIEVNFVLQR
ncbi:MAG TPA: energy transducer TonB [Bryobacteraceae bacterium]|nr:energy transducer TonB [Bryobacteraceae bacterium]